MSRLETLTKEVRDLYESKHPNRTDWADWLYAQHIFVVVEYAITFSKRFGVTNDLSAAAGMLHDIGDAVASRFATDHAIQTETIARELLSKAGYSKDEIAIVVDDAMKFHSCRDNQLPKTIEGKIMATADAVAHLNTNYYDDTTQMMESQSTREKAIAWAREKIDRDFNTKIFFDEIREESQTDYNRLCKLF